MRISNRTMCTVLFAALTVSGCQSVEKNKEGFSNLTDTEARVVINQNLKASKLNAESYYERNKKISPTFDSFPNDQVPHILLKKPVAEGRLTSGHGYRINPSGIRLPKRHKGIDYAAPEGTAVLAAGDGVVEKLYFSKSYGNYIRIRHANGFFTVYAHLQEFSPGLAEGTKVVMGQIIGKVGMTGRTSGPHLHYELIFNGKFVDPLF